MQGPEPSDQSRSTEPKGQSPGATGPSFSAEPKADEIPKITDPRLYINREVSLLSFQWRVLAEAWDVNNPLLERCKFLSIVGSNLEEFFMVRVAGLKRQMESAGLVVGADGLTPDQQMQAINSEVIELLADAQHCLHDTLLPALKVSDIHIHEYSDLSEKQKNALDQYFLRNIFPVLTPLAFDPGHPFPHISNLSLNLGVLIRDMTGKDRFARVKIPETLPQLIRIATAEQPGDPTAPTTQPKRLDLIWLDDLVRANLDRLFPGMTVVEAHNFQVIRDAELEIQEWEAEDLLETTQEVVRQRRFGDVVALQVDSDMPAHVLQILMSNLQVDANDVYLVEARRPLSTLKYIASLDRYDLKFAPFIPSTPSDFAGEATDDAIFTAINAHDVLVHHPYDSFQPVVNFLTQAAVDPNVLAIKMTLYRVGMNSPVVEALLQANENRKQVAVLVELKARFDEESNIEWAKALEREGVHVVYGLLGLKIHGKIAMVIRKEGNSIRRYIHLGTGNYNAVTAHLYTDIGLFTCNEQIADDVTDLFNYLTGYSAKRNYKKLLVAPINMRQQIQTLIRREIEFQRSGKQGHIILKINALVDEQIIQLLYEASQAGVRIELFVRGICCLRPGVPGVSENICVTSIVGRFLEHSRIFYFNNGGNPQTFCGSADLMPRNLDRRVEVIFPIEDPQVAKFMRDDILETYRRDRRNAWKMQPDGSYVKVEPEEKDGVSSQQWFMTNSPSQKERQSHITR
jgi:polyphosphate kinase